MNRDGLQALILALAERVLAQHEILQRNAMKTPRKKPRYHGPGSTVETLKRRREPADNGKRPWGAEELNHGWTLYVLGASWRFIMGALKRSERSCVTMFEHKVIAEPSAYPVRFESSTGRRSKHWTTRDHATVKRCLAHGWTVPAIAKLLGRTETAVEQHVNKRQAAARPTLT